MPQHRSRRRALHVAGIGLATLLVVTGANAPSHAQGDGTVEFVTPRNLATVLGPSSIELRVSAPSGLEVVGVEIRVDGKLLTTLSAEPWTADWDAGDGSRGHSLEATLRLSDGSEVLARVRTTALRINQVEEVDLVNLYPILRTRGGSYVTDLTMEDFRILS